MSRTASSGRPGRRGRPRDAAVDSAIDRAVRDLLLEVGYNRMSIGAIAHKAGTSRPAIYRRWKSKAELVHEVVFPDSDVSMIADTGNLAADLSACMDNAVAVFSRPEAIAATPGLMAEFRDDPQMRRLLRLRLEEHARKEFARLIAGAKARHEVRSDIDANVLFDAFTGAVFFRVMIEGETRLGSYAQRLTDLLLHGLRPAQENRRARSAKATDPPP
jgi:AcrR family transcriptional regulator